MANNTISQIQINGTTYDLLDAATRSTVSQLDSRVSTLEDSVGNFQLINLNDCELKYYDAEETGLLYSQFAIEYGTGSNTRNSIAFNLSSGYITTFKDNQMVAQVKSQTITNSDISFTFYKYSRFCTLYLRSNSKFTFPSTGVITFNNIIPDIYKPFSYCNTAGYFGNNHSAILEMHTNGNIDLYGPANTTDYLRVGMAYFAGSVVN